MKKSFSKKIFFLAIIVTILVLGFIGWIVLSQKPFEPDPANMLTINQGTQMHYNDINIGLASIEGGSAWLFINKKDSTEESQKKLVTSGDKFEAYGYTIEIKQVNSTVNFISKPGAGSGYIKLIVNKK